MDTIKNKKPIDITPKHLKEISAREKIVIPEINYEMGAMLGGIKLGGDDSTINDRSIKTIASAINADGNFIKELINDKLNTSAKTILSDFNFGITDYAGAVKSGDIAWDANGENITGSGVAMYRKGLVGAFEGVIKFSLNAENGNAIFAGTLSAAAGTLGAITIGTNAWHVDNSGNMWWGNYASYAAASIKISAAGLVDFTTGNFSGTLASGISIESPVITGGTITGSIIQTATSGLRVRMSSSPTNKIEFLNNDNVQGILQIVQSGDDFELKLGGDGGGYLTIISSMGASQLNTVSMPFFEASGKASSGDIYFDGSPNYPRKVGLTWSGGGEAYFDLGLSGTLTRIQSHLYSSVNNTYDLGSATYKWRHGYLSGNLVIDGNVDGVDVSAFKSSYDNHTHTHASLSGVSADQHHSSLSDALNITPATVAASGTGSGTSSALKSASICTTGGLIYYGTNLVFDMYSAETRTPKNFVAATAGSQNLGSAGQYWNDVSYKTLTDRGCLGWFDEGVELQDGRIVSDIEALKVIKKHPILDTTYGKPRLDYRTMPKVVYKKAEIDGKILDRDENDNPYFIDKKTKEKKYAEDGAETTALISIMIGAIKELNQRLEKLEK